MRSSTSLVRLFIFASFIVLAFYYSFYHQVLSKLESFVPSVRVPVSTSRTNNFFLDNVDQLAGYFESYPLDISEFGQVGKRLQILGNWIFHLQEQPTLAERLVPSIERTAQALFPFLLPPSNQSTTPLLDLRHRFQEESKGIVILTGKKTFRYACHLIQNIRVALRSDLPIEIAYAGDDDLPAEYRTYITSLSHNIRSLDVAASFDSDALSISGPDSGWAVKPFAVLASNFSSVILLDADAVLFQPPEELLNSPPFLATGTYLFHDRLLWPGAFPDRHQWWESHLKHIETLSPASRRSKVVSGSYSEEGDSGLVLVDKTRLNVFMGLLHICWQNSKSVREAYTYKMGYGDKESWWFGFELSGVEYFMEDHYAAIIGTVDPTTISEAAHVKQDSNHRQICSFQIAHVAHSREGQPERLLWLNGSLLKNKVSNMTELLDPEENTQWMVDGQWIKKARKIPSCMVEGPWNDVSAASDEKDTADGVIRDVDEDTLHVLSVSVEAARKVDERLRMPDMVFEEDVMRQWFEADGNVKS